MSAAGSSQGQGANTPVGATAAPAYRHQGRPVSRDAFYAIACDPRRSVVVEACAGAGKTWMLVSRIVRALLDGCAPQDILAITFTRKAAGEMRARLLEWLDHFSRASDAQLADELRARGLSGEKINEKGQGSASNLVLLLRNLQHSLIAQGRPVQIRTFHSWFAALLRAAPLAVLQELGLPPRHELLEDDSEAVAQVWRRFHRALASRERLQGARADFLEAVAQHGRSQVEKALTEALARRTEFLLADAHGAVDGAVAPFGQRHPSLAAFEQPADALATDAARATWLARAQALGAEKNATPRKAAAAVIDAFEGPPDLRLAALRKAFFVADEDRLTQHLAKQPPAQEAEVELQRLCAAQRQHEAWQHQGRMARLTRVLIGEFTDLKRERGWVDMNDVERAAGRLLSDPVLGGWMQERLDARVRHLLIDEFQDTNPLQWQALSGWLSGYAGAGSGAPSVFIVGDPKQSIYRFRRAEPKVFEAAQRFVVEAFGGDLLACDHTRRCALAVRDLVNTVMGEAQAAGDYPQFAPHTTESDVPGAVLALPRIERTPADAAPATAEPAWRDSLTTPRDEPEETWRVRECRQAAAWLAAQIAAGRWQPRNVLVLARKREPLRRLQEALQALGVASQQPEKTELAEAPEVQDLLAVLDVLVSPAHDLSLARALKSPLFGVGDDALVALARLRRDRAGEGASWRSLLGSPELPAALRAADATLTRWQGWLEALPPHDALDALMHDGDVLARFAAAAPPARHEAVVANLRALLAASLALGGARYATPYGFVRALKAGGVVVPPSVAPDAVQLLTIHGAKGLEGDCVLWLDTDPEPPKAETMGLLLDWPGESAHPRRLVFMARESAPPACAGDLLAEEQKARAREELNALYVAMTRARQTLVVSASQPHRAGAGSVWSRLAPHAAPEPVPAAPPVPASSDVAEPFFMPELPVVGVSAEKFAIDFDVFAAPSRPPVTEEASTHARIGQAMHRLLEWLPGNGAAASEWTGPQRRAVARGFALDAAELDHAVAMARRIRHGQAAWAWDPAVVGWQGNEVELLWRGELLRIDRLVQRRDSGQWWVLDHKSATRGGHNAAHMLQLQRYLAAVAALHPGATVRAALLDSRGGVTEVRALAPEEFLND